ncbi:MAG: hypothetical protein ACYC3W_10615 [Candidatus Nanopelagicales bacterium]
MNIVENYIGTLLRSNNYIEVKNGLSNVLYWGYAQIRYRDVRVNKFKDNVTEDMIDIFINLVRSFGVPSMIQVKNIKMPEYSGVSFVSKILMFLCPEKYCVLDQQLAKLRMYGSEKALNALVFGDGATTIRITRHNEDVYGRWLKECAYISENYYCGTHRVVDIERGFFNTIQQGNLLNAQLIYNSV